MNPNILLISIIFTMVVLQFSLVFGEPSVPINPNDFEKQDCELMIFDQWQPTVDGEEMIKKWLDVCVERELITFELIELGRSVSEVPTRDVRTAYKYANGDVEKTIQLLLDPNFPDILGYSDFAGDDDPYVIFTGNSPNLIFLVLLFIVVSSGMIIYFVKKNKI
ncbi:MAG: hypothetical protein ACE5RC_08075 [Nitrosopumilus sp.]